jgi:hypothetical protein
VVVIIHLVSNWKTDTNVLIQSSADANGAIATTEHVVVETPKFVDSVGRQSLFLFSAKA